MDRERAQVRAALLSAHRNHGRRGGRHAHTAPPTGNRDPRVPRSVALDSSPLEAPPRGGNPSGAADERRQTRIKLSLPACRDESSRHGTHECVRHVITPAASSGPPSNPAAGPAKLPPASAKAAFPHRAARSHRYASLWAPPAFPDPDTS